MRLVANAGALAVTATAIPNIDIVPLGGSRAWSLLILAAIFGVVNTLIKPLLQAFVLPFIFDTLGGAVIVINSLVLYLLDAIAGNLIHVRGFLSYVLGGLLVYAVALVLENVLGVTPPIPRDDAVARDEEAA